MVNMLWELVYNENEQDNTSERIHKQLWNFSDYLESLANQVQEYEKQNQEEYTWKNDTIKFAVNDYKLWRYPNRTEKLNRNTSSTRLNIKNKINKILKAITKKS
jgi:phage host-nuclease inhibitor protein Gam